MAKRLQKQNLYATLVKFLGSKKFLWIVVGLFVLQSLWIALSFRYPMIYDEGYHFQVIQIFAEQLSPFIVNQPMKYDHLGDLSSGAAGLYHYLMSFPYRLVDFFVDNSETKIIFLRVLNVAMSAIGLYLFSKLFRKIGIQQIFINIGLLLFILLPIVPFVAAHINYDNMLFPLTALFFILSVNILQSKKVNWLDYAWLVSIGSLAVLIKYTFLPIFAVSILFLCVILWRRFGAAFFSKITGSFRSTGRKKLIFMTVIVALCVGMTALVYGQNIIHYGSPRPACTQTMTKERCMNQPIAKRNAIASETKDTRPLMSAPKYTLTWLKNMHTWLGVTGSSTAANKAEFKETTPIISKIILVFGVLGVTTLAFAWRYLPKNISWYFLMTATVTLIAAVFYVNYTGHLKTHSLFAIQPRYMLSVAPILIVMSIVAVNFVLRKWKSLKLVCLTVLLVLFTQGGGVITHIIRSEPTWYWQNSLVVDVNEAAQKVLRPLVYEGRVF